MALVRWSFESGVNGDTLTASNAGADSVILTGGTATISTAQAVDGTRSALMNGTSTSGALYLSKTLTSTTQLGADTFLYVTTLPSVETNVIWIGNGTTRQFSLALATDGKIRIRDGAGGGGANIWTSTASLSTNAWYRISIYATQDAANGTIRAAFYSGTSSTPQEDSTLLTARNTGSSPYTALRVGPKASTGTTVVAGYFDNYGYDTTASGLPPIASAPVANVTASVPQSLIDASTSTGTSLSYSISQVSGPSKTPANIAAGKWLVPIDTSQDTVWSVTITQPDSQTDTKNVTVVRSTGQAPLVEMLYATGPGTFV